MSVVLKRKMKCSAKNFDKYYSFTITQKEEIDGTRIK